MLVTNLGKVLSKYVHPSTINIAGIICEESILYDMVDYSCNVNIEHVNYSAHARTHAWLDLKEIMSSTIFIC